MTTQTKPSSGALRAAEVLAKDYQMRIEHVAEIIDQESGLAELLEAMNELDDILSQQQPGMPPLNHEWADLLRRKVYIALAKAEPKDNPNATVRQVAPLGRWTEKKGTV